MANRRVLVTGWGGYIGPVVVRELMYESGNEIRGLDTGWFLSSHPEPDDLDLLIGDLRDGHPDNEFDAIVHLAGLSNDPLGDLHPNLTMRINYQGTVDLIRANPAARHVFVSSCSVYGANALATEESAVHPLTAYASSKVAVDEFLFGVDAHVKEPRYNAASLRLGTVYGYSPGHRLDLVVNKMTHDAVMGKDITVDGNAARPLTHIEDVASAICWALDSKERGIFNVVGQNWRIRDLAHEIASFTGAKVRDDGRGFDQRDYMATTDKIRAEGWAPKHTVEGSLPVLCEKSIALPPGEYTRIGAIKSLVERGILTPQLTRVK